jgi:hypothetical protein
VTCVSVTAVGNDNSFVTLATHTRYVYRTLNNCGLTHNFYVLRRIVLIRS